MNLLIAALGLYTLAGSRAADTETEKTASATLALTAYSSDPDGVAVGSVGPAGVQISEIWVSIKDVRLREATACDRPKAHAELKGPFTAELVAAKGAPHPTLSVEPARYCRLEATLRRSAAKAEGTPPRLRGYSVLVRGRVRGGPSFEIRSRLASTLLLRSVDPQGFGMRAGATRLFVAVDAARWMSGLDLTTADPDGVGEPGHVVRIDDKTNAGLLARFEKNLGAGVALYRDDDGDGVLAPRERAPSARLASTGD